MSYPQHVLQFVADKFDQDGWLFGYDERPEEIHWLMQNRKARWKYHHGVNETGITLLGDMLDFRIALYWKKEFGLTLLTSK